MLEAGWKIPRGFGLRRPSAAFASFGSREKSGGGPPQSRTLTRGSKTSFSMQAGGFKATFKAAKFQLPCAGQFHNNFPGNGVCRPAWENRLTVSALMTPTNKTTFAGTL
jgi:hypothetical protein